MPKRIIISVTNDISTDQRVLKMCAVLSSSGYTLILVGRVLPGSMQSSNLPYVTKRFRMIFKSGFLFYMFYNIRLFLFLLTHRSEILVSNDLDTLLPNYIISRLFGSKLVFDSHEYFTGVPELAGRKFVRSFWKAIERKILPGLEFIITVSNSIADLYADEYGVKATVVRNIPGAYRGKFVSRNSLNIDDNALILVLQGRGLNRDRGGIELIDAVNITEGVHLIVIGAGDAIVEIKQRAATGESSDRITFLPVMSWEEMMSYTGMADIGLSLDKPEFLNSRMSLPNKVFDYIAAGLAVISTRLPEIEKVINAYECGLMIDSVDKRSISDAICLLRDDRDLLHRIRQNSIFAAANLTWENESTKVKELYRKIGLDL